MKRKDISIDKVYDARALRVVVGDKNGTLHGPAVRCCYSLLDIVHRYFFFLSNFTFFYPTTYTQVIQCNDCIKIDINLIDIFCMQHIGIFLISIFLGKMCF